MGTTTSSGVLAYLSLTAIVAIITSVLKPISLILLSGLTSFQLLDDGVRAPSRRKDGEGSEEGDRKGKQGSKRKDAREMARDMDEKEQLQALPVQKVTAVAQEFYVPFDKLCLFFCMVAANAAAHLISVFVGWKGNSLLVSLCVVSFGISTHAILKSEFKTRSLNPFESVITIPLATLAGIFAYYVLICLPEDWNRFNLRTATEMASYTWDEYMKSRGLNHDGLQVSYTTVAGILATLAGILSGLLFVPTIRTMRCYMLATNPPQWGKAFFQVLGIRRYLLHISILFPIYTCGLWIEPFAQALGLSSLAWQRTRPFLFVASSVFYVLPLHINLQSNLNRSLLVWHEAKKRKMLESKLLVEMIRLKLQLGLHTVTAVGVQFVGPALLLLILGVVSFACDPLGMGPVMSNLKEKPLIPIELWHGASSFLGWWMVVIRSIYCIAFVLFYALGKVDM